MTYKQNFGINSEVRRPAAGEEFRAEGKVAAVNSVKLQTNELLVDCREFYYFGFNQVLEIFISQFDEFSVRSGVKCDFLILC